MKKSTIVSYLSFAIAICTSIYLVSKWMSESPPELRTITDPGLLMGSLIPLTFLLIGFRFSTINNKKVAYAWIVPFIAFGLLIVGIMLLGVMSLGN